MHAPKRPKVRFEDPRPNPSISVLNYSTSHPLESDPSIFTPIPFVLKTMVNSESFELMVDTSATISCVSPRVFVMFPNFKQHITTSTSNIPYVETANGQPIPISGVLTIPLQFSTIGPKIPLRFPYSFYIVDIARFDFIAGRDFLDNTNAFIDVPHHALILFGSHTLPFSFKQSLLPNAKYYSL